MDEQDPLAEVVRALKQGLGDNLVAVVLFGSQARREADPESDWDLLVLARRLPEKPLRRHFWLKELLPEAWRSAACDGNALAAK